MRRYVIQRIALVPVVAFLVASLVFLMVRLLPGDIITVLAAEAPQYGNADALRAELGLDQSLGEQYLAFMTGALRADFGDSLFFRRPVTDELVRAIPVTVELALFTVLLSVALAVPLGTLAAATRNSLFDRFVRILSIQFLAIPTFWLGTLVLTFAALWFGWTPPLRYRPIWHDPTGNLTQFLIPVLVLALATVGLKLRLVRAQMLDALSQDYVRTAQAKGLRRIAVIRRHALRNALVPVVAIVGNQTGALLGGAAVTESIFNLPGLGRVLIEAVDHRDYPTIQAVVLVTALLLVTVNLLTDLLYAWLDPRIRYA